MGAPMIKGSPYVENARGAPVRHIGASLYRPEGRFYMQ